MTPSFRRFLTGFFASALIPMSLMAQAEPLVSEAKKPIIVELFSSQSCGACPAANEALIDMAETENVFPLVWSVSYWEYIGVKEPYAGPGILERQRRYADSFDLRGPYTPQVVIDGCVQNTGSSPENIRDKIEMVRHEVTPELTVTISGDTVVVGSDKPVGSSAVWLAGYLPGITELTPERGRNAGQTLRHMNLATSLKRIGDWDGLEPERFEFECKAQACVVIVQESATGEILDFGLVSGVSG